MLTRFLFCFLLYPLSILPIFILYGIAYLFYLVVFHIIKYRKNIILLNLRNSFPEKEEEEIKRIMRKYYLHLAEIAAEMLKMLAISRKQLLKRYQISNPELVNKYYEQGRSVILMSSHYNNWEWMVLSLSMQFRHHGVGVGKANSNKVFEKWINRARTRYGTEVVFADHVRECFAHYDEVNQPVAYMMLSDQSPNSSKKCYVTQFLNQKSGTIFGAEYFAKKYNIPVVYYQVIKDRIGYYHIEIIPITDTPTETEHGYITEQYVRLLEKTIQQKPEYWLWSHRRWKLKFD